MCSCIALACKRTSCLHATTVRCKARMLACIASTSHLYLARALHLRVPARPVPPSRRSASRHMRAGAVDQNPLVQRPRQKARARR